MFVTYFNAGVRVYDIADAENPTEVAHWIPATPEGQVAAQINDIFVDADHTIFATDRVNGGVYILQPEEWLNDLMAASARS